MKNRHMTIAVIVLLVIVVVILTSILTIMLKGNIHFGTKTIMKEKIVDETYTESFATISITADAAEIEIKNSTDKKVHLIIYGDENRTTVSNTSSKLEIETKAKRCFGICFNIKITKVELYIPEFYENDLEIKNKYGDIKIEDLPFAKTEVTADCGNINIDKIAKARIENNYGNISIDSIDEAEVVAKCGDIDIENLKYGNITNNLGDIKISKIVGKVDIREDCGNVKIASITLEKDSSIENSLGDITIGKTNEIYIDARTSLGDVKINNNFHQSDITLKIKNSAGDIKVRN